MLDLDQAQSGTPKFTPPRARLPPVNPTLLILSNILSLRWANRAVEPMVHDGLAAPIIGDVGLVLGPCFRAKNSINAIVFGASRNKLRVAHIKPVLIQFGRCWVDVGLVFVGSRRDTQHQVPLATFWINPCGFEPPIPSQQIPGSNNLGCLIQWTDTA